MKASWELLKKAGPSLFLLLMIISCALDYLIVPMMGKIWGLILTTTPEGFISNANALQVLLHSPWVFLLGLILVFIYIMICLWQIYVTFLGIAYIYHGKHFKVIDLIHSSILEFIHSIKPGNFMVLVYALIIVPLANVYQMSSIIKSFQFPEYIRQFIDSHLVLFFLEAFLVLIMMFLARRWIFVLPAHFLRKKSFKESVHESFALTKKGIWKPMIKMIIYRKIETIRLSVIPYVTLGIAAFIFYLLTYNAAYARDLLYSISSPLVVEVGEQIAGPMIYISTLCFVMNLYMEKIKEKNENVVLPELRKEAVQKKKIHLPLGLGWSLAGTLVLAFCYFTCLALSEYDPKLLLNLYDQKIVVAHKGYSSKAPENTMASFELAANCDNADMIELDVWNTADGIPVVIHNASIEEATGVDAYVYDLTYAELQEIPAVYNYTVEEFPDARIPSLEEVLAAYADKKPILIEIKGYQQDPDLAADIVALMDKYDCKYTSMIHSGDYSALKAVKEIDPNIKCGLIQAVVTGNTYDLPYADFFSVEHTFITTNMISNIHKRGKKIYAWTVNYDSSAETLSAMNVDGLITDYPDTIAVYVATSNHLVTDVINGISQNTNDGDMTEYNEEGY